VVQGYNTSLSMSGRLVGSVFFGHRMRLTCRSWSCEVLAVVWPGCLRLPAAQCPRPLAEGVHCMCLCVVLARIHGMGMHAPSCTALCSLGQIVRLCRRNAGQRNSTEWR
jgi:hypothetical protein